ncbi:MAG: divergent PAP2 family protein [Spirochaetales bacterium]|nr:divergent PAP2 family protein [Spirochaetales bacterium]
MFFHFALILSVMVHISCQIFKFIFYSIRVRKISVKYLVSAGGMPSTHSAFTSTLTLTIGLFEGFTTPIFAVSAALTAIVVYDSLRLRGAVQIHSEILEKLSGSLSEKDKKRIPKMVGHTLPEIVVGILIACIVSTTVYLCRASLGIG